MRTDYPNNQRRLSSRTRPDPQVVAIYPCDGNGIRLLDIESPGYVALLMSDRTWAGYSRGKNGDAESRLTPRQVLQRLGLLPARPRGMMP